MATAQILSFKWDRVEAGLGEWAAWALGLPGSAVLWAGHRVGRLELPFALLERISGPTQRELARVRLRWRAPTSVLASVQLPAVGDAARLRVDGWTAAKIRAPGEGLGDVRDALLEQLAPELHLGGWSAAAEGAGGIRIEPGQLGDFARVDPLRNVAVAVEAEQWSRRISADLTARVRFTAVGPREQDAGAWAATARLAMDDPESRALLARYGLAFQSRAIEVDPRDLEGGPEPESRAAFDAFVAWTAHRTTPLGEPLAGAVVSGASALLGAAGEEPASVGFDLGTGDPP